MSEELKDDLQEKTPQEEIEEPEVKQPEVDPEAEAEARKYGWKPKEDFTLAPDGWVDASRFLELPSTQLKMVRDVNRTLEHSLRERDARLSRVESSTKSAMEKLHKQLESEYQERIDRIKAEQKAAVEVGDVPEWERLEAERGKLKPPEVKVDPPPGPTLAPEIQDYMDKAAWLKNPEALAFATNLVGGSPEAMSLPPIKQVQWAERKVKEYFPELFPEQSQRTARVDGGGVGVLPNRKGKGADDLPPEARAVGAEFVKSGLFKTLDEYARDYFEEARQ